MRNIKIAIHHQPGSFSDRWIEYCKENNISYQIINCYESDIIHQLKSFDVFLWHWHQDDIKAILFARQLIISLEYMGIKVFPNIKTCWHFDDKVGQKYLFEAVKAPLVHSYAFYDKAQALDWVDKTDFPKVFKLRGGAGARNVRLVRTPSEAKKLCNRAFGKGFESKAGYFTDISTKIKKTQISKNYFEKIKRFPSSIWKIYLNRRGRGREKGYIYFQDFIPNNKYDTRVTIIGNRAFAFRRMTRDNDFRASGSGQIDFDTSSINIKCIEIAFDIADKLQTQSAAFDFVETSDLSPFIVEISYGFIDSAIRKCTGHYDKEMNWHSGKMWPQDAIIEDITQAI